MKKTLSILALVPCILGLLISAGVCAEVGTRVPDFAVHTLAGDNLSRASLAGRPLLLVFWNTWCTTCAKELPKVSRIQEKFAPRRLTVLAINTGLNDSENKARAYWQKHGYTFPVAYDHSFQLGESFKVMGVPTVILVDAQGVVRYNQTTLPLDLEERVSQLSAGIR